jgi:hypothetical protein
MQVPRSCDHTQELTIVTKLTGNGWTESTLVLNVSNTSDEVWVGGTPDFNVRFSETDAYLKRETTVRDLLYCQIHKYWDSNAKLHSYEFVRKSMKL